MRTGTPMPAREETRFLRKSGFFLWPSRPVRNSCTAATSESDSAGPPSVKAQRACLVATHEGFGCIVQVSMDLGAFL